MAKGYLLKVCAAGFLSSAPGFAQEPADQALIVDTIEVTGSVPIRSRTDAVAPELVFDRAFFERFEPLTAGDALKRVPGITFTSDVGEFEDPGFRGLANGFTQVLINGRPVTTAGGEDGVTRTLLVDRIPAELIDRIEIIRSPGADIESQGVAGTINIVLREGADLPSGGYLRLSGIQYFRNVSGNDGALRGTAAAGYVGKALNDRLTFSINGNVQQRLNTKFSVQEIFSPSNFADLQSADDALGFDADESIISDGEIRTIQNDERENLDYAINADIGYTFAGDHRVSLSGFYIRTDRDERADELVFENAPGNLVQLAVQDSFFIQDNFGITGSADFVLSSFATLELSAGLTRFDSVIEALDLELDAADVSGVLPTEASFRESFSVAPFDLLPTNLEVIDTLDQDVQLNSVLDVELKGLAEALDLTDLKFRAGIQIKRRDRDSSLLSFEFEDGILDVAGAQPIEQGGVFRVEENRYDSFLLFDGALNERLSLETGIRFEVTETNQIGIIDGIAVTEQSSDFDVNPSAHLRYQFNDWVTARLSYARTVRRPDFSDRIPFVLNDLPEDLDTITGNPGLRFETSNGLDAGLEFKIPGGGIAGVNAFWRDISDLIQLVDLGPNGLVEDGAGGLIIGNGFTFENVGDATAYGVEFDLSTPLSVIGLPNTGLFANYSFLRSEVNNAFVDLATTPINGQPRFAYNLGLTHEFPAYGLTLGVSYQDQGTETSTFFDQTQTTNVSGNLEAFVEKRFADRWVARLQTH